MKKLISTKPENTISFKELSNSAIDPDLRYYGVLIDNSQKGFITREQYRSGQYTLRAVDRLTSGNGWFKCEDDDLISLLKEILDNENRHVFVFNTHQELFKWLAEE